MPTAALKRLATLLVVTLVAGLFAAAPAAAREEEEPLRPKVEDGAKVKGVYDPMPVSEASSAEHDPETCALVPWCSLILITPQFPKGWDPETTEFVMTTVISWQSRPLVEGTVETNDLDIYAYYYDDVLQDDGTTEKEYREVNRAASGRQPERMKLFGTVPENPTIYLVVYNFAGPNLGFTVDIEVNVVTLEDPDSFYPAAPGVGGGTGLSPGGGSGGGASDSSDSFGALDAVPYVEPALPSDLPSMAPAVGNDTFGAITPSAAFSEGFGSFRGLAEDLAASGRGGGILDAVRNRAVGPPKPVTAPVLVFWLVLVPLALLAATATWLVRRRPAALRIAV